MVIALNKKLTSSEFRWNISTSTRTTRCAFHRCNGNPIFELVNSFHSAFSFSLSLSLSLTLCLCLCVHLFISLFFLACSFGVLMHCVHSFASCIFSHKFLRGCRINSHSAAKCNCVYYVQFTLCAVYWSFLSQFPLFMLEKRFMHLIILQPVRYLPAQDMNCVITLCRCVCLCVSVCVYLIWNNFKCFAAD